MKLDKILRDDCGIDIKKDLGPITKLFIDFKENGYNVTNIVTEYNKAVKLRWDIAHNEMQIEAYQKKLTDLSNEIHACQSILNINRKNWDTYQKLEVMKFGIDELEQLYLTVSEIVKNRGDPLRDFDMIENPVAFFYQRC